MGRAVYRSQADARDAATSNRGCDSIVCTTGVPGVVPACIQLPGGKCRTPMQEVQRPSQESEQYLLGNGLRQEALGQWQSNFTLQMGGIACVGYLFRGRD